MTIPPKLLSQLEKKLGVGPRQVNNRINERARTLLLPREQAALALALEQGVNINRLANDEDWKAIRTAAANVAASSGAPRAQAAPRTAQARTSAPAKPRKAAASGTGKKVFVVSGRHVAIKKSLFRFLRALGVEPKDFNDYLSSTKKASPYLGEVLAEAFKDVRAAVVLFTPDDEARLKKEFQRSSDPSYERTLTGQARPNVIFEAGAALALMPDRTVLVQVGNVRPFSDLAGIHFVHLTNHAEGRLQLAQKLRTAGCKVDTDGRDWLTEGDFG